MGDTGEPQTENETTSDPKDLDSLTLDSNTKGSIPLLRVAVDDNGDDSADHRPDDNVTAPHLRVAIHDDDDGDEDMSGEEHEESEEENGEEHLEEEEEEDSENPMEEPVVEDADTLSSVRIVAHVTDGMADSDTGEQLAFPDEQYDEESEDEHGERYEDDRDDNQEEKDGDARAEGNDDTHEEDHDETHEEDHGEAHKEHHETYEEDNIVDDYEKNKETRAVIHVQGYADKDEDSHEEQLKVLHDGEMDHQEPEMGQHEDYHTQARSEDDQDEKVDELQALINLAEEEGFEGDKMEDEVVHVSMNGSHIEENVKEQPAIADVRVNGELPAHHDQSEVTEHARHSVVTQHDQADATSTKPAEGIAPEITPTEKVITEKATTEKKKLSSTVTPHGKPGRPSSAPASGARAHASDGPGKAKRDTADEGEGSDSTSRSRGAHTRPSVRGSRGKVTVPQPFHLATEKRASLVGRPTDPDATKPRTRSHLARKPQLAAVTKTPRPVSAGIRAAPTEISKEDQEETLEKDREAKLEEELIAALRIKAENPSGFSFKSDERAEKRREFYSKLEEKMKAKEEEKNQNQAKTQEELENKMKLLRKSLTFKATPLPSFYQESAPPKVEVRKIPPTRPKSPKLTTSRRSSLVGDREGSKSPVARIRNDLRASGLGLQHKSVDSTDSLKPNVRKSVTKIPSLEKPAVRPKVNGDGKSETPRKAVPASVMPSPRKTLNAESGTNRTQGQEKKADTATASRGRSTDPRSLHNGGPATDRPKTAEEGKTRNGKPSGGVTKADGVRKSMQWRETSGSSARREILAAAEPVKLVIATPTKGELTPVVPDVAVAL